MSLWGLSSRGGGAWAVVGAVAQHRVDDVEAASGQADEGGVVFLALVAFAVVVGPGFGVLQGGERGQEQRVLQPFVPGPVGVFAFDGGPGAAGDRGQAGVGGQVRCGGEGAGVTDLDQDAAAVLTPTPGMEVRTSARGLSRGPSRRLGRPAPG